MACSTSCITWCMTQCITQRCSIPKERTRLDDSVRYIHYIVHHTVRTDRTDNAWCTTSCVFFVKERTRLDDERFQQTSNSLANFSLGGEEKNMYEFDGEDFSGQQAGSK